MLSHGIKDRGYLCIGDVIYLKAEGFPTGYLGSLGAYNDRCAIHVEANEKSADVPLRGCRFRVCPARHYTAVRQWQSHGDEESSGHSTKSKFADVVVKATIRHAVDLEEERNIEEEKKAQGKVISFGDTIQLLHIQTNKFVTIKFQQPSEGRAVRIGLDSFGNENSWFTISPFYKFRSNGDKVMLDDHVQLVSTGLQQSLCSSEDITGSSCGLLVGLKPTPWRVKQFLSHANRSDDNAIKSGDVVRLFHTEAEMFLTGSVDDGHPNVFLRSTGRVERTAATGAAAMWELEVAGAMDPLLGRVGRYDTGFRFRHIATGMYLRMIPYTASDANGDNSNAPASLPKVFKERLTMGPSETPQDEEHVLFELCPTQPHAATALVRPMASIWVRASNSGSWLARSGETMKAEDATRHMMASTMRREEQEAWNIVRVAEEEVRDLDTAVDATEALKKATNKLPIIWPPVDATTPPSTPTDPRAAKLASVIRARKFANQKKMRLPYGADIIINESCSVLVSLIAFVLRRERELEDESFEANPLEMMGKFDRERQKLLRDVGALDVVLHLLAKAAGGVPGSRDAPKDSSSLSSLPMDPRCKHMCRLGYRLLKLSTDHYRKSQEWLAQAHLYFMQNHLDLDIGAGATVAAVLGDNPKLLEKYIRLPEVEAFFALFVQNRKTRFVKYIVNLCSVNGVAVPHTQQLIVRTLFAPGVMESFISTELADDDAFDRAGPAKIMLTWKPLTSDDQKHDNFTHRRSLLDVCSGVDEECNTAMELYLEQMNLFSQISLARNAEAAKRLGELLPLKLLLIGARSSQVPPSLRAVYCKLISCLHLDKEPYEPVSPMIRARCWSQLDYSEHHHSQNVVCDDDQFEGFKSLVFDYLDANRDSVMGGARGLLTVEIVKLAVQLVKFGVIVGAELKALSERALSLLRTTAEMSDGGQDIRKMKRRSFVAGSMMPMTPASNKPVVQETAMQAALGMLEILSYVVDVEVNTKTTRLLRCCRRHWGEDGLHECDDYDAIMIDAQRAVVQSADESEEGLDVVVPLLRLLVIEHKPLVLATLQLLFKFFKKTKECLALAKDTQLLITEDEEKQMQQLQGELKALRGLVRDQSLWIKPDDSNSSVRADQEDMQKQLSSMLKQLAAKCGNGKEEMMIKNRHTRRLLTNLDVPKVVVEVLTLPVATTSKNIHVFDSAVELICSIAGEDCRETQRGFMPYIPALLSALPRRKMMPNALSGIFCRNRELCNAFGDAVVSVVGDILKTNPDASLMKLMATVVLCDGTPIKSLQSSVMISIATSSNDTDCLTRKVLPVHHVSENASKGVDWTKLNVDEDESVQSWEMDESMGGDDDDAHGDHEHNAAHEGQCASDVFDFTELSQSQIDSVAKLVELLSACAMGNEVIRIQVESLLPMSGVCGAIRSSATPAAIRVAFAQVFMNVYLRTNNNVEIFISGNHALPFIASLSRMAMRVASVAASRDPTNIAPVDKGIMEFLCGEGAEIMKKLFTNSAKYLSNVTPTWIRLMWAMCTSLHTLWSFKGIVWGRPRDLLRAATVAAADFGINIGCHFEQKLLTDIKEMERMELARGALGKLIKRKKASPAMSNEQRATSIEMRNRRFVTDLERRLEQVMRAEHNLLVSLLRYPECLLPLQTWQAGRIVKKLVADIPYLTVQNPLLVKGLLVALREMTEDKEKRDDPISMRIHRQYFGDVRFPAAANAQTQKFMGECGACGLVVHLVTNSAEEDKSILYEALQLGVALNDEGNADNQQLFLRIFHDKAANPDAFFRKVHEVMVSAAMDLKDLTNAEADESVYIGSTSVPKRQVYIMLLRFLQLFCENHNLQLQNCVRVQKIGENFNLVERTISILNATCGGAAAAAHLLGLFITEKNVELVSQTLNTLNEYCQGPCPENQECIAEDPQCLDIVWEILLGDMNPLALRKPDVVLELRRDASILLGSLMEGRHSPHVADRLLEFSEPAQLIQAIESLHSQSENIEDSVGHNVYLLAAQLATKSEAMKEALNDAQSDTLDHFRAITGRVQIVRNNLIEELFFPVPTICGYFSDEVRDRTESSLSRDVVGSQAPALITQADELYDEMKWYKEMETRKNLYWISSRMMLLTRMCFFMAVFLNLGILWLFPISKWNHPWIVTLFFTIFGGVQFALSSSLLVGHFGNFGNRRPLLLSYRVIHTVIAFAALCWSPLLHALLLLDILMWEPTLRSVIRSVTVNYKSLLLTAVFAFIIVYLFSIFGYLYLQEDFLTEVGLLESEKQVNILCVDANGKVNATCMEVVSNSSSLETTEEKLEHWCDSIHMCLVSSFYLGLRSGGGIGDVLRHPSRKESDFSVRVAYDLLFYFFVIVIGLNLVLGIIIDTFAGLRSEREEEETARRDVCALCGLNRAAFDHAPISFQEHVTSEHDMWSYLWLFVHLKEKDPTEFTGQESFVSEQLSNNQMDWMPRLRALSLEANGNDTTQVEQAAAVRRLQEDLSSLRAQMDETMRMIRGVQHDVQELNLRSPTSTSTIVRKLRSGSQIVPSRRDSALYRAQSMGILVGSPGSSLVNSPSNSILTSALHHHMH